MVSGGRIAVALPWRESFVVQKSGAVALCARDFARFSRFVDRIEIVGAGPCGFDDVRYRRIEGWRRWWRRDRDAYARAVADATAAFALIEAQNRPYMIPALRRRSPEAKIALHLHNDPQTMDGSRSLKDRARLLDLCDAIYCVSDFVRARFLEGLADRRGATVTIHNGVLPPALREMREPIVAFTGRLIAEKGVGELARAFSEAELPGWRLVLAGPDPEGLWSRLGEARAGLGARLEWLGQVSHAEAMDLLARAEIAVAASMWDEPFGRAAIEAMASGAALVASRRGALPEVCGGAAVFVDPPDVSGFAAALRRLAEDPVHRRDMQAAARARATEAFDIRRKTAELDAVRSRLLGET